MSKYFKAYNAVKNLIKGSNTSPTISSVKPSVHKTKRSQKRAVMKEQFDKQKNRTISDRNKASAETFDTSKGKGKDIQKRNEATKKMFDDANGRTKKAEGGAITPRDINKNGKTDDFERARAKGMAKGMGKQFRDSKADGGRLMKTLKEAAKKAKDKRASDRMKNSRPDKKSGSSTSDIFKSYGKYDGKEVELKDGGKATHKTKDGRTVKKGLYYYMNRAKKRGTSKPGKGSVTDKALKQSAKTAKKD